MKGFFALLRLQLLSRYADMKPRNLKAQFKSGQKGRTIGKLIGVLILLIYLGVVLFVVETKLLDALLMFGMPDLLISLVMMLATVGTLIMSFFFVLSSLYFGRDAAYLAALPLKPRTILSAKLTQVWVSETCINAIIVLPACILYGIKTGAAAGFYLRLIPVWLLISLLPICVIALLSSLLVRASALLKHREMLMTVGGIVLLVAYMIVMMNVGGITGDSAANGGMILEFVRSNHSRIAALTQYFPPARWAAEGLLGMNYGLFVLWILVSLAAVALTVWLLGLSYRRLSLLQEATPAGTKKKLTGRESFGNGSQLKACIMREIKMIYRVPSYAMNILPICFMPLLMVLMITMAVGGKASGDGAGSFQTLFAQIPPAAVMGILAAIMGYMGGMNPALSTAVSREGKGHTFLTALPVSARTLVKAKFIVGLALGLGGVLAASVALLIIFPGFAQPVLFAFILCLLFGYLNSAMALSRDIKKPRLDWVTEQEAVKQNYGVLFSMLTSWGILIALAGLTVVLMLVLKLTDIVWIFLILAAILLALCILTRYRLYKVADKYYCQG